VAERISVVIPAYNEEDLLPDCLAALRTQAQRSEAEIIVVDNDSSDRTAAIALKLGARVVTEKRRGYVFALECGIRAARNPLIAATDADSMVGPDWLARIQTALAEPGVAGVTGPVHYEGLPLIHWLRGFLPHDLWGANMAFRKADLEAIGGVDCRVNMGADLALSARLRRRGRIAYDKRLCVRTSDRRFSAQPLRQSLYHTLNYTSLKLLRRPLFWHFTAIRDSEVVLRQRMRKRLIGAGVTASVLTVLYLCAWPSAPVFGKIVVRPDVDSKLVALTFDDGPNGEATRTIVDILAQHGVPATFFEVGRSVEMDSATVRYVADHGFAIGNHSWDHGYRLPLRSISRIEHEMAMTEDAITHVTGNRPVYFRPPHGWRSTQVFFAARRLNLRIVNWSLDAVDYLSNDPDRIARNVLHGVRPGSIILLHDGLQDGPLAAEYRDRRGTILALPRIIETLQRQGYTLVTIDELLAAADRANTDSTPPVRTSSGTRPPASGWSAADRARRSSRFSGTPRSSPSSATRSSRTSPLPRKRDGS